MFDRNQLKASIALTYETSDKLKAMADQALLGEIQSVDAVLAKVDAVTKENVTKVIYLLLEM